MIHPDYITYAQFVESQKMNDQIKKCFIDSTGNTHTVNGSVSMTREDIIKFANAIVLECVRTIGNTIDDCTNDDEKMGCEYAITDVLYHFGVEE